MWYSQSLFCNLPVWLLKKLRKRKENKVLDFMFIFFCYPTVYWSMSLQSFNLFSRFSLLPFLNNCVHWAIKFLVGHFILDIVLFSLSALFVSEYALFVPIYSVFSTFLLWSLSWLKNGSPPNAIYLLFLCGINCWFNFLNRHHFH